MEVIEEEEKEQGDEGKAGNKGEKDGSGVDDGQAELVAVSLQGSNTLKASGCIWRTRTQKGNSANISSSKTLDSSTSPTGTR